MRAPRDVPLRDVEPVIQMIPDSNPARGNVVDRTQMKIKLTMAENKMEKPYLLFPWKETERILLNLKHPKKIQSQMNVNLEVD